MAVPYTIELLRAEIDNDPLTLGYDTDLAQTNGPELVANKLNLKTGAGASTLTPTYTSMEEVRAVLVGSETEALSQGKRDNLIIMTSGDRMKTGSSTLRTTMAGIFAGGTTTRANLVALTTVPCSRAENLWGEGQQISAQQVSLSLELEV